MLGLTPNRRTQIGRIVRELPAPDDMFGTGLGSFRIDGPVLHFRVGVGSVPVGAVLHDVPEHIFQSERIGQHGRRLLRAVRAVLRIHDIAVDPGRIGIEKLAPESAVGEILRTPLEEIGRRRTAACGVFPFGLGRQAVFLSRFLRQPLAERLGRIVRHRDSRPLAASPTLIGRSERRRGIGIIRIDDLGRRPAFGHRLGIESPVHVPCHLGLAHEKRRDGHLAHRSLVVAAERFVLGTAHRERTSRYGLHVE